MRKLVLIIIGMLLISTVSYAVAEGQVNPDKLDFYMYGAKTCPHCRKMKEEIPRVYGNDSLTYYELVDNTENQALFGEQYRYTGISGVPAIGIAYEGELKAIVEGEFNVSAAPKIVEAAIENDGLILVMGGKAYIIKNETIIQKLQVIYVEHRNPDETVTTTTTPMNTTTGSSDNGICGPGILVALAVIPLVLRKRRR
ncbi:CGP-CTERM sorting domain-containing protein [Thermococcus sp. JdF3]|uniref:CGP-CTERM sorting domain-containing protein n=1 Tax=Thermococcus sp. JdF3 TaxID=1638258 RepID=UPI00143B7DCD|nr:CGP-CTERM sorting domain-containing protein [Thermococcus sp. JdF3]NJE01158.1 CGP-CTERM sorting domain-containing protein [Thermococcus sp. JdF3]